MRLKIIIIFTIILVFTLTGCEEPIEETERGLIYGQVQLRDEFGVSFGSHSGVKIEVEELDGYSTISDTSGYWEIGDESCSSHSSQ